MLLSPGIGRRCGEAEDDVDDASHDRKKRSRHDSAADIIYRSPVVREAVHTNIPGYRV